jgi:acyl-CoA reductase-like NAD-dependent aldehyde dehydrogenase
MPDKSADGRVEVQKTYKLYIGGEFPRSESGRVYPATDAAGNVLARVSEGSRKDLRDAVKSARAGQTAWSGRSGYNRAQILYRIAEMVEDRAETFVRQLSDTGLKRTQAARQVARSVDRLVWYAGWGDKFAQVFGNLNPVAGPFFNISTPEPTGVVGIIAPETPALLGLVSRLAPVIITGNTAVVLASERWPMPAITFSEALATADVPGGVVNILTGPKAKLIPVIAAHMDVNAIDAFGHDRADSAQIDEHAAHSVKRVVGPSPADFAWDDDAVARSPYMIADFTEIKTVWHPKGT